ncbi:hypothetical protein QBC47DRAFT_379862 [Echria macrotheca]|uniref:NADAR domain-containing protein n=1 Tax=Echria macrotheca TaxID=438768 RepID=A0AAJ0BFQ7_9PEZI|nr:hypothetical protein QBC47DRAFT_379862 [Echria macrotheca]
MSGHPPQSSKYRTDPEPLFFHLCFDKHGEFCHSFPSSFTVSVGDINHLLVLDGQPPPHRESLCQSLYRLEFHSVEQFMRYCEARMFTYIERQRQVMQVMKVMQSTDGKTNKLDKKMADFYAEHWSSKSLEEVAVVGNMAKFGQNPELKRKLLGTRDRMLVQTSSTDHVWGIGFKEKDAMQNQVHWGENKVGKALMFVRKRLREQEEEDVRVACHM